MSESMKPRFAVDLDGVERQFAQPQRPAAPASRDPLTELARIVGQDDPYQSLLAGERARRARAEPTGLDDLFAVRDEFGEPAPQGGAGLGPHGGFQRSGRDYPADPYRDGYAGHGHQASVHGYDSYGAEPSTDDGGFPQPVEPEELPPPRRRSRKRLYLAGAVVVLAALAAGSALMPGGPVRLMGGGPPPLVKAMTEPTKVPPQSPGGVEIPNQNKQIYEPGGREVQTKVVDREEQPVDIRQATRGAAGGVPETMAGGAPVPPLAATPNLGLGEPRRVRTVSVRPDGTVIGAEAPAGPAASAPVAASPAASAPALAAQPQTARSQSPAAEPAPAPAPPVPASTGATGAAAGAARGEARTPSTTPATALPRATPSITVGGNSPPAEPEPAVAPRAPTRANPLPPPQPVSPPVQQAAVAPEPAPAESAGGGYAVQLAVRPSESEAKAAFQQLQQRYASVLGGRPSMIRRAEVNGSTLYRVRVGPLSKDEASTLCSRVQAAGGQCFVAKN